MLNHSNKYDYTAAGNLPAKLLKRKAECVYSTGRIAPYHVQVCPTNVCNLNCEFCSCKERERGLSLDMGDLVESVRDLRALGTKAMTITGGGEPCCYPHLDTLIEITHRSRIRVGLVTNAYLLHTLDSINRLTWCRVSVSDDRDVDKLLGQLDGVVQNRIDWAFSYVVTKRYSPEKLRRVVEYANRYDFTHVRVVGDLMDIESTPTMAMVRETLSSIDDSKVIYQDRRDYTRGARHCLISLLKPVLAPDGYFYPCCGVQYAKKDAQGTFPEDMRMFRMSQINSFYSIQQPFNGIMCDKCYYSDYNDVLAMMRSEYEHEEFI